MMNFSRLAADCKATGFSRYVVYSIVKTEVIFTIPKSAVMKKIGFLPAEAMSQVDECLRVSLSL